MGQREGWNKTQKDINIAVIELHKCSWWLREDGIRSEGEGETGTEREGGRACWVRHCSGRGRR